MTARRPCKLITSLTGVVTVCAVVHAVMAVEKDTPAERTSKIKATQVPLPKAVPEPKETPTTAAKVELGKLLFFDPRLSGDNSISCATCHLPDKGFGDGKETSPGFGGAELTRNTPGLWNIGFVSNYFWDGRAKSLEEQALGPIESPVEMNQNIEELEQELAAVSAYHQQFQLAFGTGVTRAGIAQALAAFQRTLLTGPSPYDRYLAGDEQALTDEQKLGMELFFGDADCVRCHNGVLLTDEKFYRVGVSFSDQGRADVTKKRDDRFKFRTPPLRNVAQTAPYMHDGSMSTLTEVVTFYYRGVPAYAPEDLPLDVEPLTGQSFSDIPAVAAFLEALTGELPVITPPEIP